MTDTRVRQIHDMQSLGLANRSALGLDVSRNKILDCYRFELFVLSDKQR